MENDIVPQEISLTKELGKATLVSAAISAASIVGMYVGIVGVAKVSGWNDKRKAKKAEASNEK